MTQAAENYITVKQYKLKSLKKDKARVRRVCFFFKALEIKTINYWSINEFVKTRKLENCANSTINRDLSKLSAVFQFLIEIKKLRKNPVKKSFYMKEYEKEIKIFTKKEYAILITKETKIQGIILFALTAGLRHGEILRLKWENINMQEKLIKLFNDTKTFKGRIIPMSKFLFDWLSKQTNKTDYIFPGPHGKVKTTFEYLINTYFKEYSFEHNGRGLQSMRHTYATMLLIKGVDIRIVQELLGHASIITTMRYTHVNIDMKRDAIKKLEEFL